MTDLPENNLIAKPDESIPNRGLQVRVDDDDNTIYVTLQQIDETLINYVQNIISPTVIDNERVVPVPVVYANPERWKSIRKDGFMRDQDNDKAQTPLIVFRRVNVGRNPDMSNPNNKYLYLTHQTRWNSRNTYDRFAVQNGIRPSLETHQVIVPDYVDITYEVILWTELQSQLNGLIEQINVENEEWWGVKNQYKFRVRIDDYSDGSDLPAENQRFVRTAFNMNVSAYLVPERMISNFTSLSTNSKKYTVKKVISFVETDFTNSPEVTGYYDTLKAKKSN